MTVDALQVVNDRLGSLLGRVLSPKFQAGTLNQHFAAIQLHNFAVCPGIMVIAEAFHYLAEGQSPIITDHIYLAAHAAPFPSPFVATE
jgi:hypothetical protein